MNGIKTVINDMAERNSGTIINISSVLGHKNMVARSHTAQLNLLLML